MRQQQDSMAAKSPAKKAATPVKKAVTKATPKKASPTPKKTPKKAATPKTTPKKASPSPAKSASPTPKKAGKAGKAAGPPKRGQSAFFIWMGENRAKIIKDNKFENKDIAAIGKKAGELWGKMSDAAKAPFQARSDKDKARYEKEMKNYDGPMPEKKIKKGGKSPKDKNKPKRGQSAFFIWLGENRAKIIKDNKFENKDLAAIGKKAGEMWGTMSDAAKAPFQKKAEKDKARYEKEMANYTPPSA